MMTATPSNRRDPARPVLGLRGAVFDVDGVLTDTAGIHAAAWKAAFGPCLEALPASRFAAWQRYPFDEVKDYLSLVDGKPRLDGALAFLASRGLRLPEGRPGDAPGCGTPATIGEHPVEAFPDVEPVLTALRAWGVKCAAVSPCRHAGDLLIAAGIHGCSTRSWTEPRRLDCTWQASRIRPCSWPARVMRDAGTGGVLVVGEGRLRGILTDRDIVIRAIAETKDPADTTAYAVCSTEPVTVRPGDDVDHAVDLMRRNALRRLPVETEDGELVGVVTLGDLGRTGPGLRSRGHLGRGARHLTPAARRSGGGATMNVSVPLISTTGGQLLISVGRITSLLRRLAAGWLHSVYESEAELDPPTTLGLANVLVDLADQIDAECIAFLPVRSEDDE